MFGAFSDITGYCEGMWLTSLYFDMEYNIREEVGELSKGIFLPRRSVSKLTYDNYNVKLLEI